MCVRVRVRVRVRVPEGVDVTRVLVEGLGHHGNEQVDLSMDRMLLSTLSTCCRHYYHHHSSSSTTS